MGIITFGGATTGGERLDDIYILDIRSNSGWTRSSIKCPMKSRYIAAIDQQRVHLYTYKNNNKQHYCIALKDLIPELHRSQCLVNEVNSLKETNLLLIDRLREVETELNDVKDDNKRLKDDNEGLKAE